MTLDMSHVMPVSYQDAIMVPLAEKKLKQALDTLQDFSTEKYFPTKKLSGQLFDYFLTDDYTTAELIQFLSLYKYFLEIHGSKVFASLWKPTKTFQPFWKNLQVIWERRDEAIKNRDFEQTHQYELLMEFLLLIVRTDIENGMVDGALMNYCGVEDIQNWFPGLDNAFSKFLARIDKKSIDYLPQWISLVFLNNKIGKLGMLGYIPLPTLSERIFDLLKFLDRDVQIVFLQKLEPFVSVQVIDWIFCARCSYPKVKNLSESSPSMKKLIEYHAHAKILDDVKGKGKETRASFGYFFTLWFIYLENLLKADLSTELDPVKVRNGISEIRDRFQNVGDTCDIILMDISDKLQLMSSAF